MANHSTGTWESGPNAPDTLLFLCPYSSAGSSTCFVLRRSRVRIVARGSILLITNVWPLSSFKSRGQRVEITKYWGMGLLGVDTCLASRTQIGSNPISSTKFWIEVTEE